MNIMEHIEKGSQFKNHHDCYVHIEVKDGSCISFSSGDALSVMLSCTDTMVKILRENHLNEGLLLQIIYDRLKESENAGER